MKLIALIIAIITLTKLCCVDSRGYRKATTETFLEVQSISYDEFECMVLNKKYDNSYLYALSSFNRLDLFSREVMIWAPLFSRGPNEFTDTYKDGIWIFKPVPKRTNTYYLQNKKYGEYLFANEKLNEQSIDRRLIFTYKLTSVKLDEKYMWNLKHDDNEYEIWNVKYNERKNILYFCLLIILFFKTL